VVRNVVANHFSEPPTTDPDVTAQAIRGAEEFGWRAFLSWSHKFASLPLADDAALEWVCDQVERTDEAAPSRNLKSHLSGMLAGADIGLLDRHRERLLGLAALRPADRRAITMRPEFMRLEPAECWRRLEDHCRQAATADSFAAARIPEAILLLEPLEHDRDASADRVVSLLQAPTGDFIGDDAAEWLTGLMIALAGRLRLEEATAPLWNLLAVDWDWYQDEGLSALKRIGTTGVVQIAREHYEQSDWTGRLHATSLFAAIRCDESAAAIAEALAIETDDDLRAFLGMSAAEHLDDGLTPLARAVYDENPADPERRDIREYLVALSHLTGQELPERDDWERDIDEFDDRISRLGDPSTHVPEGLLGAWAEDDDAVAFETINDADEPASRGFRVGRNEPCPCGSGRKFKRCCMPST
jgi:hypothetical protein